MLVFNPSGWRRTDFVRVVAPRAQGGYRLVGPQGEAVEAQVIEELPWGNAVVLGFVARDVPPVGYKVYRLVSSGRQQELTDGGRTIENEFLRVEADPERGGALRITDKRTGFTMEGVNVFVDEGDAGDEYNWSPLEKPEVVLSKEQKARVSLLYSSPHSATLRVQHRLRIPVSVDKNRSHRSQKKVDLPITSDITVRSGSARVDIETFVENAAEDHRLRVLFPTGIDADQVSVDEHFDVVQRSTTPPPPRIWNQWELPPYPTEHQKGFVDVTDGKIGFAVLNNGLPEYESIPERNGITVALTLFRSVGWLSRGDMITRPCNAGPSVPAPEAQCKREMRFRYAIYPHKGDWMKGKVVQESRDFHCPVLVGRADQHGGSRIPEGLDQSCMLPVPREGALPDRIDMVQIDPDSLVLSAFKQTQDGRGAVCRFYNPTGETQNTAVRFGMPVASVREASLNENPIRGGKSITGQQMRIQVKPKKIVTLQLRFK